MSTLREVLKDNCVTDEFRMIKIKYRRGFEDIPIVADSVVDAFGFVTIPSRAYSEPDEEYKPFNYEKALPDELLDRHVEEAVEVRETLEIPVVLIYLGV